MEELFESGRIIDIILGLVALEAAALAFLPLRVRLSEVWLNLVSGACLMLALRAALTQAGWEWIAMWLAAALVAHAADLIRLRRRSAHDAPQS
ncbi:MAG: hypothetical protein NW215_04295 [Hyphomicrobiales bacterium]|nr:hypothetical protein [Hyphomicrobiales bacterium]